MKDKKIKKEMLSQYKKDTNGLFDGGFKSQVFDTKEEKESRRRKSTSEWLEYAKEEELDYEE